MEHSLKVKWSGQVCIVVNSAGRELVAAVKPPLLTRKQAEEVLIKEALRFLQD